MLDMMGRVGEGPDREAPPLMPLPREERSCRLRKVPNVLIMVSVPGERRVGSMSAAGDAAYVPLCSTAELGFELVMGVGGAEMRPSASVVASWTSERRKACWVVSVVVIERCCSCLRTTSLMTSGDNASVGKGCRGVFEATMDIPLVARSSAYGLAGKRLPGKRILKILYQESAMGCRGHFFLSLALSENFSGYGHSLGSQPSRMCPWSRSLLERSSKQRGQWYSGY